MCIFNFKMEKKLSGIVKSDQTACVKERLDGGTLAEPFVKCTIHFQFVFFFWGGGGVQGWWMV